jgi:hypothetical protein
MKLADTLLREFEPDMAKQLIAFGQKLSKVDTDIFVFLARKSLCLYDVLLKIGTPPIQCCVVNDRVLDMQLEPFRGNPRSQRKEQSVLQLKRQETMDG